MDSDDDTMVPVQSGPVVEKEEKRGVVGMANLGNTCFMNACIQNVRHILEWTIFCTNGKIKEHIQDESSSSSKILLAYTDLLKSLWAGSSPAYVNPKGFYHVVKHEVQDTLYEDFGKKTPQDAHEFLVWLLDQMYMGSQNKVSMDLLEKDQTSMNYKASNAWKNAFEKTYSPLSDIIFGLLRIQNVCQRCNHAFYRWETFNTLKIGVERMHMLENLEDEFGDEMIEDYDCEHCKAPKESRPSCKKTIKIWRLPKILILTLKRFEYENFGRKKLHNVAIDETIKLEKYFVDESKEVSKTRNYKLFGTIDHHGHAMGGHYTAQSYSLIYKHWYLYDDETAYNIENPMFGPHSYLLFYRQEHVPRSA